MIDPSEENNREIKASDLSVIIKLNFRTAVSELGSTEPVILDESFCAVTEADLMKAGSSPKQSLSTVASPDPYGE